MTAHIQILPLTSGPDAPGTTPVAPTTPAAPAAPAQPAGVTLKPGEAPATPERPAWLPPKFADGAALAQAYSELEKRQGSTPPAGETPAGEQPAGTPATPSVPDLTPFEREFAEKGQLSAESYTALAKAGLSRQVIDRYIAGQIAVGEAQTRAVQASVGGPENYQAMVEWANTELTAQERDAYNRAVESRDQTEALMATRGLFARFQAGKGPELLQGKATGAGTGGVAPYNSRAELVADQSKPEYRSNEAFRAHVDARLRVTTAF